MSHGFFNCSTKLIPSWRCRAFGAGCVASLLLAFAKAPVFGFVLELQPDVLLQAQSYWWLRCALVPVLLLNMSISGILQVCLAADHEQVELPGLQRVWHWLRLCCQQYFHPSRLKRMAGRVHLWMC